MPETAQRAGFSTKTKVAAGAGGTAALAAALLLVFWPQQEGTSLVAYQDSIGVWTICQGDTHNVTPDMVETPAGCEARMRATIGGVINAVDRLVPGEKTVGQYISYGDFIGNAGEGNFASSSMRRYAMQGRLQESCDSFRLWIWLNKNGKPIDCRIRANNCYGIVSRRETERKWCLGDLTP